MSAAAIAAALGGAATFTGTVESDLDLAAAIRRGISAEAAARAVASGLLTPEELYSLVLPRRTYDRRREDEQPLTVVEADRLLRAVGVVVRAIEALGDPEKARAWLRTPNRALNGEEPMALLETDVGARLVERTLGRIEHGVYS
jgi:putative toxin-antitoxin system antitoxin component (TIGR02293 family)